MSKAFFFFFFFYRIIFRKFRVLRRNNSNINDVATARTTSTSSRKYRKFSSLGSSTTVHESSSFDHPNPNLANHTLIFNVEETLLKSSSSLFPYFMLVAFEAGSVIRALLLLLSFPFVCLASEEMGLKIMAMVSFFGLKKDSFRVGSSVLPKYFLEDVGHEMFQVVKKGGKKVGFSTHFPQVMIECFLRDYLEIDLVVGRDLKVFCGYFVGLMEEKKTIRDIIIMASNLSQTHADQDNVIAFSNHHNGLDPHLSSLCKEVYLVSRAEKRKWQNLAREKYPKPLIFHDGRLAFKPTLTEILAFFIWFPFGFFLSVLRLLISISSPYSVGVPILAFTGMHLTVSRPQTVFSHLPNGDSQRKGNLYVCNHRSLLDPVYLSSILQKTPTAVTYSLSRMSEILSPIKTVRLTRNRDQDAMMMERLLKNGDIVVCPEGTTCREPYLLRFSPLFSEMSDVIIPVANDSHVSMIHGTTASGLKCLDPLCFLMNPYPSYTVHFLDEVYCGLSSSSLSWSSSARCHDRVDDQMSSRFDVANIAQREIGRVLKFECTKLTRRDKYLILAGNEGIADHQAKSS